MEIQLGSHIINYEIIRKNNKNIYFRFNDEGTLIVSCNRLVTKRQIEELIKKNEKAMLKMYNSYLNKKETDSKYHYLGEIYTIVYDSNITKTYLKDNMIFTKDIKSLAKWEHNECLNIFKSRINAMLENFYNIPEFTLRIRKMKTRWGVNNVTKRIITLNSELLKKDVTLIDYVIVHELCHFYEANHSHRFWAEVAKRYPYYKLARKRLRVE